MSIRLTYSRLRGEYIIQLAIDEEDLFNIPSLTRIQRPNLSISAQLIYLSSIVDSIESTKEEEKDMLSQLTSPIVPDEEPVDEYDLPPIDDDTEPEEPLSDDPPFPDEDDFIPTVDDPDDDPLPIVDEED